MSVDSRVKKIIDKYSKILESELLKVVGYKTGNLYRSIDAFRDDKTLKVSMLEYGQYINPWIKKTGSSNEPGYIKVSDKVIDDMLDEIEDQLGTEILKAIPKTIKIKI